MSFTVWGSMALSAVAVILLPLLKMTYDNAKRWQKLEDTLAVTVDNLEKLVRDKDRVHQEMNAQMREDRSATDRRLRWLEENVWNKRPLW